MCLFVVELVCLLVVELICLVVVEQVAMLNYVYLLSYVLLSSCCQIYLKLWLSNISELLWLSNITSGCTNKMRQIS